MNPLAPNRQPRNTIASARIPAKPNRGQNRLEKAAEAAPALSTGRPPDTRDYRIAG
jgi:hypothetical protein